MKQIRDLVQLYYQYLEKYAYLLSIYITVRLDAYLLQKTHRHNTLEVMLNRCLPLCKRGFFGGIIILEFSINLQGWSSESTVF